MEHSPSKHKPPAVSVMPVRVQVLLTIPVTPVLQARLQPLMITHVTLATRGSML
jgi:hypothetical protein